MDLHDKIHQRQIKYYHYVVKCIDLYIDGDTSSLKDLLVGLLKMDKGHTMLKEDFIPLVTAFKYQDAETIQSLRFKFATHLTENEV